MIYSMASHPEIQKRCQDEIDEILKGRNSDEILWCVYLVNRTPIQQRASVIGCDYVRIVIARVFLCLLFDVDWLK